MADIDGGKLSFTSELDNEQLNSAIEETLKRVQGFSDAVVGTGENMDTMINSVRATLTQVGKACEEHEAAINALGDEYNLLGKQMGEAFAAGRDKEYAALRDRQAAVKGELSVRKQLLKELQEQSNVLEEESAKMEKEKAAAESNTNATRSLRTEIRMLQEQMADFIKNGGDESSAPYKAMVAELGRLRDIQADIQQQGNTLANDEAQFQGIISGISGVTGAFTAAQGAIALFGTENEALQKTMLKVQSLMSITMGLQQIQQTLNKDSAFQLVTLNNLKQWWNNLLDIGRGKQIAENAAIEANTAAEAANATATTANTTAKAANQAASATAGTAATAQTGAVAANTAGQVVNTAAATAGTAANIGLAGAFRMVGAAIKSIPVFGWILAGISALIGLVSVFASKASKAKKEQEEFFKSMAENCYKPINNLEMLAAEWNELGDDIKAKEKFINDNRRRFEELGVAINGVKDAENLLIKNKEAFIDAQIAKAKALAVTTQNAEKVKKVLELQAEIETMSDTKQVGYSAGNTGYVQYVTVENTAKTEKKKELEELQAEIRKGYEVAMKYESEGAKKLTEAGIIGAKEYAAGTVGALEQAIATKEEALKRISDNTEYKKQLDEIAALQKKVDAITGKKTSGGGGGGGGKSGASKDPFLEKLAKYKSEYDRFMKWVNSGDKILAQSARTEFSKLLSEGSTYIDYLRKQRDIILSVDVENRTKEQNKQLRQLNNAIAEETRQTVLEAFNNELQASLGNAKSAMEMLDIIEKRRKELENDGTELDTGKGEALDEAEKDVRAKMAEDVQGLLEEYAGYVERKRQLEEDFNNDILLLQQKRQKTTDNEEIAAIDAAIANRKAKYQKDSKTSGDADYDKMLVDYSTFEQKKQAIVDEFAEKRRIAEAHGNQEMIAELEKAEKDALSGIALDELMKSPDWSKMFGDLDEISTKELSRLIKKINGLDGAYLGIEFDPDDLDKIMEKIKAMKAEIQERNPFKALGGAIKDFGKAVDAESKKQALTNIFKSASSAADIVGGSINAISDGLTKMGMDADSEAAVVMKDLSGIAEGAGNIATGIATGNPLSIIQGSVGLLTSAYDLFNSRDRKAQRSIEKHKKEIEKLESAYKQLEWQIGKALGGEVYANQQAAIRNLRQQQDHLRGMINDERDKKKTSQSAINQYQDQIAEIERQIEDLYDEIANDILQTNAKDFANELGDALVEAFGKGEDAAEAFKTTVNDVLKNAIVNQLKKNFLEKQLQGALDNLQNSMGRWNGDNFVFDGLTDEEIAAFKAKVAAASNNFTQALNVYKDLFNDLTDEDADTSLTGAVKGVSEETASILAGQMNAMRINQMNQIEVLRDQLSALNRIAANTAYNVYLRNINNALTTFINQSSGDQSLRAQGLS